MINEYFLEVFESVPRQGPGSNSETRRAFELMSKLPDKPSILDIGCGKGAQTIELARLIKGHVIAMDMHKPFLSSLHNRIENSGLQLDITCVVGDMAEMPFLENQFDILWSEGAIFIIGYKEGLSSWKKYIKPRGYLAFSDCIWLKNERPAELVDYWKNEGLDLPTKPEVIEHASSLGYTIIDSFTVAVSSWKKEFYDHISRKLSLAKEKYAGNSEAQETFTAIDKEIEIFDKYNEYFGYEFFVFKA